MRQETTRESHCTAQGRGTTRQRGEHSAAGVEEGQILLEYALVLAVVIIVNVILLTMLATHLLALFSHIIAVLSQGAVPPS